MTTDDRTSVCTKPDDRTTAEWIADLVQARQKAESELAALRAGIEALAATFWDWRHEPRGDGDWYSAMTIVTYDIRAFLANQELSRPVSVPSAPLSRPGSVTGDVDAPQPGNGAQDGGERRG